MILDILTEISFWILHSCSWNSASCTHCIILCKPDGKQHYINYFRSWQSTFFISAWLNLGLSLALADSWLVCLPSSVGSLLSSGSELVEGTGLELSAHCIVIHDYMLSCKCGWSCTYTNSRKLVIVLEADVGNELPLTYSMSPTLTQQLAKLIHSSKIYVLTDWARRERLLKMISVSQIRTFLHIINALGLSNRLFAKEPQPWPWLRSLGKDTLFVPSSECEDGQLVLYIGSIGQFSEAGLLEWMRFVIFRARSCERSQCTSGPIPE